MGQTRVILHCDMNSFYASVEIMLNPDLKDLAVAVCGAQETRHGIVLAKSDLAKKAGVKTGMAIWEAKKLCPNLLTVPPQYDQYIKYSKLARSIYEEYTDYVEPYGMDECFLDITDVYKMHGGAIELANTIRNRMKEDLNLTISVGLSYNKVMAKMGSDMKKPDALTVIRKHEIPKKIWPLSIKDLFFCGPASAAKLQSFGIKTIGDLAHFDGEFIKKKMGKQGLLLHQYANGIDYSSVAHKGEKSPIKSIGHGITCSSDLYSVDEIFTVMLSLAQDIGAKLRIQELRGRTVQVNIRHSDMHYEQKQGKMPHASRVPHEIATYGKKLVEELIEHNKDVLPARSVTIRVMDIEDENAPVLESLFADTDKSKKKEKLFDVMDDLRKKYGKSIIKEAVLMNADKIPERKEGEVTSFTPIE